MIKSTALLTVALFLAIAPSPDADLLSEITGGFLKADSNLEITAAQFDPAFQTAYNELQLNSNFSNSF